MKIQEARIVPFQSMDFPEKALHLKAPLQNDVLVTHMEGGRRCCTCFSKLFDKLVDFLFCCFPCLRVCVSEPLRIKLGRYARMLKGLREEFKVKEKECKGNIRVLRLWWVDQFDGLPRDMQRRILLRHVEAYAPKDEKDRRKWAEKNFKTEEGSAQDLVIRLESQTIHGKKLSPGVEIPSLLSRMEHSYRSAAKKGL